MSNDINKISGKRSEQYKNDVKSVAGNIVTGALTMLMLSVLSVGVLLAVMLLM